MKIEIFTTNNTTLTATLDSVQQAEAVIKVLEEGQKSLTIRDVNKPLLTIMCAHVVAIRFLNG